MEGPAGAAAELTAVDRKINAQVPEAFVRKDLAEVVKRQCGRPSYVLEYLPGSPVCPTTMRRSRRVNYQDRNPTWR